MKIRALMCVPIVSTALLAACSEPQQAAPVATAPAPSGETTAVDAAFGAVAPTELSYDQRRERLLPAHECNLERANGTVFAGTPAQLAAGETLRLSGWVADKTAGVVPGEASLRMVRPEDSRAWTVAIDPVSERSDVQELLGGAPAFATPGFSVAIDTAALPAGKYRVYTVYKRGGDLMSCDNGRAFAIGG